jgi:OOP family OmpA-OmpF porin
VFSGSAYPGEKSGLNARHSGHTVEEIHDARLQRILCANHEEAISLDQLLQDLRSVSQVICGGADVCPHGLSHQGIRIVAQLGLQQGLHRGADAIHDRTQIPPTGLSRLAKFLQGGENCPAPGVAEHHHNARTKPLGGELHAADLGRCDDIAGHTNDKEVTQALIEDELRRHPRVGTSENNRERLLSCRQLAAARPTRKDLARGCLSDEATVSLFEAFKGFLRGDHRVTVYDWSPPCFDLDMLSRELGVHCTGHADVAPFDGRCHGAAGEAVTITISNEGDLLMNTTRNRLLTGCFIAGAIISVTTAPATMAASTPEGYLGSSSGQTVKDSSKDCVRTSAWSRDTPCEPPPAPVQEAKAPTPVPPPAPAPKHITLSAKTLFGFDKATLTPEGKAAISNEVDDWRGSYETKEIGITLTGYTDSTGPEAYNQRLSERRADAVRDYLVHDLGVNAEHITAVGKGEADPVASNATREGRAQNRRVEMDVQALVTPR